VWKSEPTGKLNGNGPHLVRTRENGNERAIVENCFEPEKQFLAKTNII
jgi:hypothetical protein